MGKTISITNGNSGPPAFNAMQGQAGIVGPPASAPTFCCSCCGSLPATTYLVVLTYQNGGVETIASAQGTASLPGGYVLWVNPPPYPPGVGAGTASWNVYVSVQLPAPTGLILSCACCSGGHLAPNTTYYYRVTAVDSIGNEAPSSETSYTTPSNGVSTNQVTAIWLAVAGALGFKIYRGTASGAEYFIGWAASTATSFVDTTNVSTGAPCPTTNTTGVGNWIKQNTAPITDFTVGGTWKEPATGLIKGTGTFVTGIVGYTSPTQVTLAGAWPYGTTPSTNLTCTFGVDDTNSIQAALLAATESTPGIVYLPSAQYMTTRRLTIGNPGTGNPVGQSGIVMFGAGMDGPDFYLATTGFKGHTSRSVIVGAVPMNQPIILMAGGFDLAFRDMAIFGPAPSATAGLGTPAAGIELQQIPGGAYTGDMLLENFMVGYCNAGMLLDFGGGSGESDITFNWVVFNNCNSFGLRCLDKNGLGFWLRSWYVNSDIAHSGFVAAQFDQGGHMVWEGGGLGNVATVLKVLNTGAGPNAAGTFVLDGLRLDGTSGSGLRCVLVDTYNNAANAMWNPTNIVVSNTEVVPFLGDGSTPLFWLGIGSNVTVRSSTFTQYPLAQLYAQNDGSTVHPSDTTLVLEDVVYSNLIPFAAAITVDSSGHCYWRSRNCRTSLMTPRFDESTWKGDGIVAPFRARCFGEKDGAGHFICRGYFRPGNRPEKYIANEFPYSQQVYGTCTGVYRNSDPYVSGAPKPALPAVPEDEYPGWLDGNSYITISSGSYSSLFNLPANGGPFTIVAWIRIPSSVVLADPASNPICGNLHATGTGAGYGGFLLDLETNAPTFKVYNGTSGTATSAQITAPFTGDTWYMLGGVSEGATYKDTFASTSGVSLLLHTSDSGASYTAYTSSGSAAVGTSANRMRGNNATSGNPNFFSISQAMYSSDHSMTCKVYIASTMNTEDTGVLCRVTLSSGDWYSLTINSGQVVLKKWISGTGTPLATAVGIGESAGATFNLTLTCFGSTISGTVTRDSDGKYLKSDGTWQTAPINVFSVTDTSVPSTSTVGLAIGSKEADDSHGYQLASANSSGNVLMYRFGPDGAHSASSPLGYQLPTTSSGACTIGQNTDASVNAQAFIEAVAMFNGAISQTELNNLYTTGINGG